MDVRLGVHITKRNGRNSPLINRIFVKETEGTLDTRQAMKRIFSIMESKLVPDSTKVTPGKRLKTSY